MEQLTTSIFKFATIRNGVLRKTTALDSGSKIAVNAEADHEIVRFTPLVKKLIEINTGAGSSKEKIAQINAVLTDFMSGAGFFRTLADFESAKTQQDAEPNEKHLDLVYDNIIVRIFAKGNTNQLFKSLVDQVKHLYSVLKGLKTDPMVIIPEQLTLAFVGVKSAEQATVPSPSVDREKLEIEITALTEAEQLILRAEREKILRFEKNAFVLVENTKYRPVNDVLKTAKVTISEAEKWILNRQKILNTADQNNTVVLQERALLDRLASLVQQAKAEGLKTIERESLVKAEVFSPVLTALKSESLSVPEAKSAVATRLQQAGKEIVQSIPVERYTKLGDRWVEVEQLQQTIDEILEDGTSTVEDNSIIVRVNGCDLKFPFFVADLRVVEHQTVGYLPGEIAHINNAQPGEINTRVTRRLKKVESYESLISEQEVFNETDTQSTEKFSLESEASRVQEEENSWNVNAKVSTKWGFPMGSVTASVDGGFATSNSTTTSNSNAQQYAKELVTRTIDRVSNKVKLERSLKTIEEFEETVTHVVDNSGDGTKSYVYRWLNKLTRATLKNFGKRLIFQFDIAHPAHFYLSRSIQSPTATVNIPKDPRKDEAVKLTINSINRYNYLTLAEKYNAKVDAPPAQTVMVTDIFQSTGQGTQLSKLVPIPKGYACYEAKVLGHYEDPAGGWNGVRIQVGLEHLSTWWELNPVTHTWESMQGRLMFNSYHFWAGMHGETDNLPVTIQHPEEGFIMNLEVKCWLTQEAELEWKKKTYNAILEGYEAMKQQAESQMSDWNPNIPGLNPSKKESLILEELKKEVIRKMNRCTPFTVPGWNGDTFEVGKEYEANCCLDNRNGEHARFLESVIDWANMTYEFHPYFYANRNDWNNLLDLSDDDPHFEAFMKASYATVRIPVHRDSEKEIAAINYIMNNVIGNYLTIPANMQPIIDELSNNPVTLFTHDVNGNEIPAPTSTIDLGIFNMPTDLVILECGTTNGVKPIGFPQSTDEPTSDIIIPRQYSPAIIADSCQ